MVRVTELSRLESILSTGLLSPLLRAEQEGRTIHEGTIWHPTENRYVKFRMLEEANSEENFRALHRHFEAFGEFDSHNRPIGIVVRKAETTRLWEDEPYLGVEGVVPPENIRGIVVPLVPMLVRNAPHLDIAYNQKTIKEVIEVTNRAIRESAKPIVIFDHFGREISLNQD
jgi:hypothetical protein